MDDTKELTKRLDLMNQRMDSFVEQISFTKGMAAQFDVLKNELKKEVVSMSNSLSSRFNRLYEQTTHGKLEAIEEVVNKLDMTLKADVIANVEKLALYLGEQLVSRDKRLDEVEKLVKEMSKRSTKVHKLFEEFNFTEILGEIKRLDLEYQEKVREVLMNVKVKEKEKEKK